jgi:hypothetical protein
MAEVRGCDQAPAVIFNFGVLVAPGRSWSLLVAYINDSRGGMLASLVQPKKTQCHIAIIFHIEIAQAVDEDFHVLSKVKKPWLTV